ncbi:MAG: hypothetical protein KDD22_05545, partial [Bdellovibrionales bacterium]|nr:hypothetical protein [Bdellovibrionales bacterium]
MILILFASAFSMHSIALAASTCASVVSEAKSILSPEVRQALPELEASQPVILGKGNDAVLVHNRWVAEQLKAMEGANGLPIAEKFAGFSVDLHNKGVMDVIQTQEGYVPAAANGNHHGNYGNFVWYRDLARVIVGLRALPHLLQKSYRTLHQPDKGLIDKTLFAAKKLSQAMLSLFAEKEQIERTLHGIKDPAWHLDPQDGFRNVIFIRQKLEPRLIGHTLSPQDIDEESHWSHKQNDALALYGHSILDGIESGETDPDSLDPNVKAELIFLSSYFQRLRFYEMWDSGAWEELNGLRTSSVNLALSFLERFEKGWNNQTNPISKEDLFLAQLRKSFESDEFKAYLSNFLQSTSMGYSAEEAYATLADSLKQIPDSIHQAYSLVFKGLGISTDSLDKRIYSKLAEVTKGPLRNDDAALLHLLLYPPQGVLIEDQLYILGEIEKNLVKPSGVNRYVNDWFIHFTTVMNPKTEGQLPFSPNLIAIQDEQGQVVAATEEMRR